MQWFNDIALIHNFADHSGTVFFDLHSGETLALTLPLEVILQQLSVPDSGLRKDEAVMQRLKPFLSMAAIMELRSCHDT